MEFLVEKIIDKGITRKGKIMYYVKWHDYDDDDENTWEPEDLLLKMNARDQIDKFNSENVMFQMKRLKLNKDDLLWEVIETNEPSETVYKVDDSAAIPTSLHSESSSASLFSSSSADASQPSTEIECQPAISTSLHSESSFASFEDSGQDKSIDISTLEREVKKIESEASRSPFEEYEAISVDVFNSSDFQDRYKRNLMIDDQIVPSSSEIIKALATKMNKSEKAVYLHVKRKFKNSESVKKPENAEKMVSECKKRGGEADKNCPEKGENKRKQEKDADNDKNAVGDDEDGVDGRDTFSGEYELKCGQIFQIVRSRTKHRLKTVYKNRVRPGWHSKLIYFLSNNTELSCKFNFKNAWVNNNGKISLTADCACDAHIGITYFNNFMSIEVENISRTFQHVRSYQLKGELRDKIIQELEHNSALKTQTKLVNELIPNITTPADKMDDIDDSNDSNDNLEMKFNPMLPNLGALRAIKYRIKKRSGDPVDNLLEMKDTTWKDVLMVLCLFPFAVLYRTPPQLVWHTVESKKGTMSISIDATGSLIQPPTRSQKMEGCNKLKHIFFYSVMAKTAKKSVPIAQMVSQDQSSEFISLFFRKMFKNLRGPKEAVCDESKALLKALSQTFAGYEKVEQYVAACMSTLQNGTAPPTCYLRIDRAHFVKNTTRKIKYSDFRKQSLLRGVIGFLIQCDNFQIALKIIYDFFTLILNENDGNDEFNEPLAAETAKKRLISLCSTHDPSAAYEIDSSDTVEADAAEEQTFLNFQIDSQWIEKIIEKVNTTKSGSYHENMYYSPAEKNLFVRIFSSLVLWSNVMNPFFPSAADVASSSDVESYFKSLKYGIFERKLHRVDVFIETHIEFVNAQIKLNVISKNTTTTERRQRSVSLGERCSESTAAHRTRSNSINENSVMIHESGPESENEEENWKNKNPPNKTDAITSRRALQSMLNPTVEACKPLLLLKNGDLSIGKKSIQTVNTCPYGSFYIMATALYADFPAIRIQFDELSANNQFSRMVSSTFNTQKLAIKINSLLRQRTMLLKTIFDGTKNITVYENGLTSINCAANVYSIIQKVLPVGLFSYTRNILCNACDIVVVSNRCFVDINIELFEKQSIKNLNTCLLETLISEEPSICTCGGSRKYVTEFSDFIMIDLTLRSRIKEISLNDIPSELQILGVNFTKFGCIEYIGDGDPDVIGHYVAHIHRRNKRWERYDDTKPKVTYSDTNMRMKGQVLFYVKNNIEE